MKAKRKFLLCLAVLMLLTIFTGCSRLQPEPAIPSSQSETTKDVPGDGISVLFINVGKADAILIQAADKAYLIDTGEKTSAPQLIRALNLYGIKSLEAVFLTHTHSDHISGMTALGQNYEIKTVYGAKISERDKKGKNKIEEAAKKLSLTLKHLGAGDQIDICEGVYFEVLGPLTYNRENDNDNSLVLKLHANGKKLLFTGDMQFAEEKTLLDAGADMAADVLKVGNHGNPDATSEEFAAAVSPQYAFISTNTAVDDNSANKSVKAALKQADIHVTEDYECGALLTVGSDSTMTVTAPDLPKTDAKIAIERIDKNAQTVTIKNHGGSTDISGFFIYSSSGSEVFVFPDGASIDAGKSVTVACEGGTGDYIWRGEDKPWSKKKEDTAILFDRYGFELSRAE